MQFDLFAYSHHMNNNGYTIHDGMNEWLKEYFLWYLLLIFVIIFCPIAPLFLPPVSSTWGLRRLLTHMFLLWNSSSLDQIVYRHSLWSTIHLSYPQSTHCLVRDRQTHTNNGNIADKWLNNTEDLLSINTFKVGGNFIKWLHFQRIKFILYWLSKLCFILLS